MGQFEEPVYECSLGLDIPLCCGDPFNTYTPLKFDARNPPIWEVSSHLPPLIQMRTQVLSHLLPACGHLAEQPLFRPEIGSSGVT